MTNSRRQPIQKRSIERVQRMLDAAVTIIEKDGVEKASTTKIAKEAGVAVGSVYQFFPDKKALLQAVAGRYMERINQVIEKALVGLDLQNWQEAVDRIVDAYVSFFADEPGFLQLWVGGELGDEFYLQDKLNNQQLVKRIIEQGLQITGLEMDKATIDKLQIVFTIVVELADSLISYACRVGNHVIERDLVVTETKRVIKLYIADSI